VTAPRFRRRRQDGRAPAVAGDFPDDGRDITEAIGHRVASWDGTTIRWEGASDIGLPGDDAYPAVDPAEEYRQAIAQANASPDPAPLAEIRAGHSPRYPAPGMLRAQPPAPDMFPALQDPPAAPVGYEVTGRETGQGWPHLFELRCAYPAALAETPIPCDSAHRDHTVTSFRALRRSAQAAGWHMDRLEQWVCPRCCQVSTAYRGLYPVTVWDALAAEAYVVGDLRGENRERARAELGLRDRTLEHYDASHKHGGHAAVTQ
jgi:hypothetical protein